MAALISENKPSIYLDHAATTPLRQEVKEHMVNLLSGPFGNPSSTHHYGRKARIVVEEARKFIAQSLHCSSGEIIFTSGGTEADNAACVCQCVTSV
ncbi:MAG: aminotransferase class V-fold PLP-dependent enzyme [Owenweeksia sp.]|nr:aminotransferase class V-fold PLP-dependent enzyme [Owenweeksia sp.]